MSPENVKCPQEYVLLNLISFWFLRSALALSSFFVRNLARCARSFVSSASNCRQPEPAARAFKELPIYALMVKYDKKSG